jgi:hypothetical protein
LLMKLVEKGEPSRLADHADVVALLVQADERSHAELDEELLHELEGRVQLDGERRLHGDPGSA